MRAGCGDSGAPTGDLSANGVVRDDGQPASVLGHLGKLEGAIARDLDSLGMTPRAAVALGLDLALTQRTLSVVDLHAAALVEGEAVEDGYELEADG